MVEPTIILRLPLTGTAWVTEPTFTVAWAAWEIGFAVCPHNKGKASPSNKIAVAPPINRSRFGRARTWVPLTVVAGLGSSATGKSNAWIPDAGMADTGLLRRHLPPEIGAIPLRRQIDFDQVRRTVLGKVVLGEPFTDLVRCHADDRVPTRIEISRS